MFSSWRVVFCFAYGAEFLKKLEELKMVMKTISVRRKCDDEQLSQTKASFYIRMYLRVKLKLKPKLSSLVAASKNRSNTCHEIELKVSGGSFRRRYTIYK